MLKRKTNTIPKNKIQDNIFNIKIITISTNTIIFMEWERLNTTIWMLITLHVKGNRKWLNAINIFWGGGINWLLWWRTSNFQKDLVIAYDFIIKKCYIWEYLKLACPIFGKIHNKKKSYFYGFKINIPIHNPHIHYNKKMKQAYLVALIMMIATISFTFDCDS